MALGWVIRIAPATNDTKLKSISVYAIQNLFIILSPICFLLFNYAMFGRFLIAVDPALHRDIGRRTKSAFSVIPPRLFSRIFLWADIAAFLIQGTGGGLQATGSSRELGDTLFLIGVSFQLICYCTFLALVAVTHIRLSRESSRYSISYLLSSQPTTRVLSTIYFSSIFILIRSVYRIIEMKQGYSGALMSKEVYLIVLDTAPLALATACWLITSPYKLLERCEEHGEEHDAVPVKEWA